MKILKTFFRTGKHYVSFSFIKINDQFLMFCTWELGDIRECSADVRQALTSGKRFVRPKQRSNPQPSGAQKSLFSGLSLMNVQRTPINDQFLVTELFKWTIDQFPTLDVLHLTLANSPVLLVKGRRLVVKWM